MYGQRPSSPPPPTGARYSSAGGPAQAPAPRSPTMSGMSGMPPRTQSPPASPPQMNRQSSNSAYNQGQGQGMPRPQSPSINPVRPSSPTMSAYQKPVTNNMNYSQNSNYGGQPTNPYQNNYNTNNSQYAGAGAGAGGSSSRSRPQSPTMSGMQPRMTPPSQSPLQYDNRNRSDGSHASLYQPTNEGARPHSSSNYNTNNSQYGNTNNQYTNNSQYNNNNNSQYNKNQGSYGNTQTNSSQYSNTTQTQQSEAGGAAQAAAAQNLQIMSNEKRTAEDVIAPAPPGLNLPLNHYVLNSSPLNWTAPADQAAHPYKEHQGEGSQYLRDFILGVNDGLITNLLLVVGLIGGGQTTRAILLAAISSAVAGAIAMGLGELVATKSQNEVVEGETNLEREHFKYHRDREIQQLRGYLMSVGLEGPLLEACVRKIGSNDETLMTVMTRFEFGAEASEELERSPLRAMIMSGRLFFIGAMPSTLPFILNDPNIAVALACVFASLCLIGVGVYKTRTTGGSPYRGAMENFACGAIGGTFAFLIGLAFGTTKQAGA